MVLPWVQEYQPDVLSVMLGHNDLNHGATPETVRDDMREYLTTVHEASPDMRIVVAEVKDATDRAGVPRFPGLNTEYNTMLSALVAELNAKGGWRITVADTQFPGWNTRRMTADGTHPDPRGSAVLAQRIGWAMHRPVIDALPERPRISLNQKWDPAPRPRVQMMSEYQVNLWWRGDRSRYRMWRVRVRVNPAGAESPTTTGKLSATQLALRDLRPGNTYRIRLQPIRHWMVGRWGPVVTVTTPRRDAPEPRPRWHRRGWYTFQ